MNRRLPRLLTTGALCMVLLTSCSTKILETIDTTTTSSVVTTTTIPTGSVAELLSAIDANARGLGNLVAEKATAEARERLRNVESIWIALKPQLVALKNDSDLDVQRIVDLVRSSVERKRPADADKASRFIQIFVDAQG
ncbi:MAG: hypothetical protein ACKOBO_06680 [Acidimicrobiales bacterium]